MIDARELSIGNKLLFLGKLVTVEAITREVISVSGYESNRFTPVAANHINLLPIEITMQVVSDCGLPFDPVILSNSDSYAFYLSDIDIKYLHQLQNFMFVSHGEKLEYKPKGA